MEEAGCSKKVIQHVLAVEEVSLDIAKKILGNGNDIDLNLVSVGAIIHDIGRSKTHDVTHGVEGSKILKQIGLEKLVGFTERHLGSGIPAEEARKIGLPYRDFMPKTVEEKIVCYADKLVAGGRRISYDGAIKEFESKLGPNHPAKKRFMELHAEIERLSGNSV